MKFLFLLFVSLFLCHICSSQILYLEDFNGMSAPVPTSVTNTTTGGAMTTYNVDGLTPNAGVAYVTDAWIAREDIAFDPTDTVAISTSWYTPAGTSDDWMVTPGIVLPAGISNLSWDALAPDAGYPDGYEVWISTVSNLTADLLLGTLAFSTLGEASTWTSRTYDLSALAPATIYIGFRNTSTDQFLLMIDDIKVEAGAIPDDVGIADVNGEYTAIQLNPNRGCPADLGCEVANNGTSSSNVTVLCNIYKDSVSAASLLKTLTSDVIATLPNGIDSAVVFSDSFVMVSANFYIFEYVVSMDETDTDNTNDTAYAAISITNAFMARDNGVVTGTLGIGSGTSGILGQNFELKNPDRLLSVEAYLGSFGLTPATTVISDSTSFVVYSTLLDGTPDAMIAQTVYYDLTIADTNRVLSLDFVVPVDLAAGTYFIGITEADSNITIGTSPVIFTPGTTWVIFGANPWRNNENYGFNVTYVLRPLFTTCPDSLILASVISGAEIDVKYEVDSFIVSTDLIEAGAMNILYDAGDHINLNQGFTVELGAEFEAVIDGCGGARYARKKSSLHGSKPQKYQQSMMSNLEYPSLKRRTN